MLAQRGAATAAGMVDAERPRRLRRKTTVGHVAVAIMAVAEAELAQQ